MMNDDDDEEDGTYDRTTRPRFGKSENTGKRRCGGKGRSKGASPCGQIDQNGVHAVPTHFGGNMRSIEHVDKKTS